MKILDFLFPRTCVGCGMVGRYVCSDCVNRVKAAQQVCPMCGKGSVWGVVHTKCRTTQGMDGLVRVLEYRGVVRKLVSRVKYRLVTDMVDEVVELLIGLGEWTALEKGGWEVMPVPLHKNRLRWRGFNQSGVVGRKLADYFGWEFEERVLVRKRETKPQVEIKGKEQRKRRLENVAGAFEINDQFSPLLRQMADSQGQAIINFRETQKRVLLVDDVWTSGATMRECAKVLKRRGVKEVWGLVVAG